ncbi:Hsp20/alpha crystallin family protein [Alicyclobacillus mengziensis]|uniref:Hsp20/alpha crystallin family protein n=1 Tax=Alicyclobacillus mengziensis TaxID=2931921 RepID=A0A9X7Z5J1_9BACL|nr:Hsp20/alpha crystallin family protein [Alicyclobacillus mengziensis]
MPTRVKTDSVRARYSHGVLRVVLTKYSPSETEINPPVAIDME